MNRIRALIATQAAVVASLHLFLYLGSSGNVFNIVIVIAELLILSIALLVGRESGHNE